MQDLVVSNQINFATPIHTSVSMLPTLRILCARWRTDSSLFWAVFPTCLEGFIFNVVTFNQLTKALNA